MALEFILKKGDTCINTYNGYEINPESNVEKNRLERKYNITLFPHIIKNDVFYKYDVVAKYECVHLYIYSGTYKEKMTWSEVYHAACSPDTPFIKEEGLNNIEYWYEYFGRNYQHDLFSPKNIAKFELAPNTMKRLREVFPCELCDNPLYFFMKHKSLKRKTVRHYPEKLFQNLPYPKINKNVGNICNSDKNDNQIIHYAWQREITLENIPFLDVVVISGFVKNGVMDIMEKHRFFLAEDFVYSPDDGDFGVFASKYFFGKVYTTKFKKKQNSLMLDRYSGKNFYKYMFSKYFIPAFEIAAKAGYSDMADMILNEYYNEKNDAYGRINYFGKNDKEIFGFKLKYFNNISAETFRRYESQYNGGVKGLVADISRILKVDTSLLKTPTDDNLFQFISWWPQMPNIQKRVAYLKSIGTQYYSLYTDYLNLCREANKFADGQGQFPCNLKLAHDSMVAYLNQIKEAKNNQAFTDKVSSDVYKENIFTPENETYCILAPRQANDLVNESYRLSHCVRTYIKDVASGYTKIYFLRTQEKKATPLVTIEVRGRDIIQARGRYNRKITSEEESFIRRWANIKDLNYRVSYYW